MTPRGGTRSLVRSSGSLNNHVVPWRERSDLRLRSNRESLSRLVAEILRVEIFIRDQVLEPEIAYVPFDLSGLPRRR